MSELASVQTILSRFLNTGNLDSQRRKVCGSIKACRTEVLGGLKWQCDQCGAEQPRYHACRDRHCPQCQGRATRLWSEQQQSNILPVNYYHLVFTLSHRLNGWVQLHPQVLYRMLFKAAWDTLKAFGQNPKRLGGELGMIAILHTWGQNLSQHVHLHCLVPGGALNDAGEWREAKSNYLFPVRALDRHFRGKLVSLLRESAQNGNLHRITRPGEINAVLDALMKESGVVYTKHCLNHTNTVVSYLARYSHRIAISNARILSVDDEGVLMRYKDYRDGDKNKTMHLEGEEFVRRYLMHILPMGFMRIRHYGFLANCCREKKLKQIRYVLSVTKEKPSNNSENDKTEPVYRCAKCRQGKLHLVGEIMPVRIATTARFR